MQCTGASYVCEREMIEDTPPFAAEVVLWHVAFDLEQDSLVAKIFLESQSVCDGLAVVAALQRSRVVYDSHRGDVCRKFMKRLLAWIK